MLIIHIRSPCKLFYQVSLNFNIKDSSSEELEVDQLDFEKIKNLKTKKEINIQENSQKILRNRYFSTSPDNVVGLQEKSPKGSYNKLDYKKHSNSSKINYDEKPLKIIAKIEKNDEKVQKNKKIKIKFDDFKLKHEHIINSEVSTKISKKLNDRKEYAFNLREKLFSSLFVKKIIFTAWKGVTTKLLI